ncbi:DNA-binding protein [Acetobacter orientalis]|uniref:helix-turn-helix domain-containing transcriptional regulator n=1 Tax=Acetobacter orientalis TaxID=146474 RepID=UPI0039E80E8D
MKVKTFDSVKAAKDPLVQEALLNMAWEDGNIHALTHALSVIAEARGIDVGELADISLSDFLSIIKRLNIQVSFIRRP